MRQIITRSAQKRHDLEQQSLAKKSISKVLTRSAARAEFSLSSQSHSALSSATIKVPQKILRGRKTQKLCQKPPKAAFALKANKQQKSMTPTSPCSKGSDAIAKTQVQPNPPARRRGRPPLNRPSSATKPQLQHMEEMRPSLPSQVDTCEGQSEVECSMHGFEVQTPSGGEVTFDQMPSIANELESLPKIDAKLPATESKCGPQKQKSTDDSQQKIQIEAPRADSQKGESDSALPSVQLKNILQEAVDTSSVPQSEPAIQQNQEFAPVDVCNFSWSIEETIDENERRVKAEEARYARLLANRRRYQQCLGESACRDFMQQAAARLLGFDPIFDTPIYPEEDEAMLQDAWGYRSRHSMARNGPYYADQSSAWWPNGPSPAWRHSNDGFAYPSLPKRLHY